MDPEIGKRAIVFACWMRSLSNGVPENDFESYMAAQLSLVDAIVSGDEPAIQNVKESFPRWQKYGG